MEQWLRQRLTGCLGFEVPDEMVAYVLTLKEPLLLDNYFESLLDAGQPDHRLFLNDLKQRMFKKSPPPLDAKAPKKNPLGDLRPAGSAAAAKKAANKENRYNKPPPAAADCAEEATTTTSGTGAAKKTKTKYVPLYDAASATRDVILLKGRHHCDCQAVRHKLVNNCLQCGRIVCEQEGSGPCLFCGQLVARDEELQLMESASKKGDALRRTLMQQQRPKGWEEAMAMRNRLLEFDRTAEKRTTVIDDESDYFRTNSVWLSEAERAKLERLEAEVAAKKHASRLATRVTLDFSGRAMQVLEEPQMTAEFEDEVLREIAESTVIAAGIESNMRRAQWEAGGGGAGAGAEDVHPMLEFPAPIFDPSVAAQRAATNSAAAPRYDGVYNRVQDKELLEIADQQRCISMHQPYASLLVAGIKRHEGRSWYTAHRGRLWVAATAKPADPAEVERIEQFYRQHYAANSEQLGDFPREYPAGCLLGCVLVQDCQPQEEYRRQFPSGESESPFVFVCSQPEELPIRFPMRGEHKIYKLDPAIHLAACKAMQRAAKLRAEEDLNQK